MTDTLAARVEQRLTKLAGDDQRIAAIRAAAKALADLDASADIEWRDFLTSSRAALVDELLTIPSPIRQKSVKDWETALMFSIEIIDRGLALKRLPEPIETLTSTRIGQLMTAAGYVTAGPGLHGPRGWQGSLKEIQSKIDYNARLRTRALDDLEDLLANDTPLNSKGVPHEFSTSIAR